jgi:hypothetical protein
MEGTYLILVALVAIVVLVKYPTHAKKVFASAGEIVSSATAGASKSQDDQKRSTKRWSIALGLAGLVIVGFGLYGSSFESPSLVAAAGWVRNHWLWLIILWAIIAALIALNTTGAVAKTLQWVAGSVMVSLFIVFPLLVWTGFGGEKQPEQRQPTANASLHQRPALTDCTAHQPCSLTVQKNGSTEMVSIPPGKDACFDLSFWGNIGRLGYKTSYRGIETEYRCTREQVLSGACTKQVMDSFRFTPEAGVEVPRHWFVPLGTQC